MWLSMLNMSRGINSCKVMPRPQQQSAGRAAEGPWIQRSQAPQITPWFFFNGFLI